MIKYWNGLVIAVNPDIHVCSDVLYCSQLGLRSVRLGSGNPGGTTSV